MRGREKGRERSIGLLPPLHTPAGDGTPQHFSVWDHAPALSHWARAEFVYVLLSAEFVGIIHEC